MSDLFLDRASSWGGGGSAYGTFGPPLAVNGDDSYGDAWITQSPVDGGTYMVVDTEYPCTLTSVRIYQAEAVQYATDIDLLGCDTETGTYTLIAALSGITLGAWTSSVTQTTPYRFYKIQLHTLVSGNNGYWRLNTFEGLGTPPTPPSETDLFYTKTTTWGGGGGGYSGTSLAVDGDDSYSSAWIISAPSEGTSYIEVDVGSSVYLKAVRLVQAETIQFATQSFLEGSNDESTWDALCTINCLSAGTKRVDFVQTTGYRYYRLRLGTMCSPNNGYWRVNTLAGIEGVAPLAVTLFRFQTGINWFQHGPSGSGTPNTAIWQYNPNTDAWDDISGTFSFWPHANLTGSYTANHFITDAELSLLPDRLIEMGSHLILPGTVEASPLSGVPDTNYWDWLLEWAADNSGVDVDTGVLREHNRHSWAWFPQILTADPDPEVSGGYYFAGNNDLIGRWDGSAAYFTQDDDNGTPFHRLSTYDFGNVRFSNLSSPNGPGDAAVHDNTALVDGTGNTNGTSYLIKVGDYFYFTHYHNAFVRWSGHYFDASAAIWRTTTPNVGPSSDTQIGSGSLRLLHYPIDITTVSYDSGFGGASQMGDQLPPFHWKTGAVFHCRLPDHYLVNGVRANRSDLDLTAAWFVAPDDTIHPLWSLPALVGDETGQVALGLYYHPETDALYAIYVGGLSYSNSSADWPQSSSAGDFATVHVMKLTSFNLSTYSFTWTEVGSHTITYPTYYWRGINYAVGISSNDDNLFIAWSQQGPSYRYNISGNTWTEYAGADAGAWMYLRVGDGTPPLSSVFAYIYIVGL